MADLATQYDFEYCYTDAGDTELSTHYEITKLPAFVLVTHSTAEALVVSSAQPHEVREAVKACCSPLLQLEADF